MTENILGFYCFIIVFIAIGWCLTSVSYVNPDQVRHMAYAHSLVYDNDLYFMNDFDMFKIPPLHYYTTSTGYIGNHATIGTSILITPVLLLKKAIDRLVYSTNSLSVTGENVMEKVSMVNFSCYLLGIATLLICVELGKLFFPGQQLYLPLILLVMGTPFGFYWFSQPGVSHIPSVFSVSLFLLLWRKTIDNDSWYKWIMIGLSGSLAVMIRNQNILFFIIPLWDVWFRQKSLSYAKKFNITFLLGSGFLIGFSCQATVWMILFGRLVSGIHAQAMRWATPHIILSLFSSYHGLFTWSPILALSVAGLGHMAIREYKSGVPLLLVFLLQVYVNASIITWWQGGSFGSRQFLGCFPLFLLGLIKFYQLFTSITWKIIGGIFALWTMILLMEVNTGSLQLEIYYPLKKLFGLIPGSFHLLGKNFYHYLTPNFRFIPALIIEIAIGTLLLFILVNILQKPSWKTSVFYLVTILIIIFCAQVWLKSAALNGQVKIVQPGPRLQWLQTNRPESFLGEVVAKSQYYGQLGTYYLKLNKLNLAENSFNQACKLNPADFIARYNLALVLVREKQYEEALHHLQTAAKLQPHDKDIKILMITANQLLQNQ